MLGDAQGGNDDLVHRTRGILLQRPAEHPSFDVLLGVRRHLW